MNKEIKRGLIVLVITLVAGAVVIGMGLNAFLEFANGGIY